MKLWGGRFTKSTASTVDEFTSSIQFDFVLAEVDITGSLAHVQGLLKARVLTHTEAGAINTGLLNVLEKIKQGVVGFKLSDEDIHMNIERLLYDEIGELAGKLHTGRSRNDQVALDLHLYVREQLVNTVENLLRLQQALFNKAKTHVDTFIPGYTHLQRAEPVRLAHHFLAYIAMLQRDIGRLCDSWKRVNVSPLGSGALSGSGINIDRDYTAALLSCESIYSNSLDAVSDRDFIVEFLSHSSLIMMHLSKLSEELILWSSQEFSFIELDDAFCTGSSMMPQKKNPDVPELVRGKTGRVYGGLIGLLTVSKGLPLAYNKDLQEDKEGLFDVVKTLNQSLNLYAPMIESMKVNTKVMQDAVEQDYSNATQIANYLVEKGVTFRQAHEITGKLVLFCIDHQLLLKDVALSKYQEFNAHFEQDIYSFVACEQVIEARMVKGGTAKSMVVDQIEQVRESLNQTETWLAEHRKFCLSSESSLLGLSRGEV